MNSAPSVTWGPKCLTRPADRFRSGRPSASTSDIPRDLHLAILPDAEPDIFYEIVIGGWGNTLSVVRKYPREALKTFERKNEDTRWLRQTPGVLSPGRVNEVTLSVDEAGVTTLSANGVPVGRWPDMNTAGGATVMVRGGWGASLELTGTNAPIRRYIGDPGASVPYWQAYDYYAKRLKTFEDSLFLKCDDDIVYVELEKLSAFIEFRRAQRNYFIVSANVVNNGVCAYLQQSAGALPEETRCVRTSARRFRRHAMAKPGSCPRAS
ncbi:MAG: hypothetical protein QM775_25585 [Pirellulales bacterium]